MYTGVYSNIIKHGHQGVLMGAFGSVGSLARIPAPLCAGYLATRDDIGAVFTTSAIVLTIALLLLVYGRCVYLKDHPHLQTMIDSL